MPPPVSQSKQGFERFQDYTVKNFELLTEIQILDKKFKKPTAMEVLTQACLTFPLSGYLEPVRRFF